MASLSSTYFEIFKIRYCLNWCCQMWALSILTCLLIHPSTSSALPIPPEQPVAIQQGTPVRGLTAPGFLYASYVKYLRLGQILCILLCSQKCKLNHSNLSITEVSFAFFTTHTTLLHFYHLLTTQVLDDSVLQDILISESITISLLPQIMNNFLQNISNTSIRN